MAGRARTKALTEELEKRARDASDLDGELPMSTLDYVCEWVESGQTIKELAADLTTDLSTDEVTNEVTYARVMAVLRAQHGEGPVEERLEASRKRASHVMAEGAMAIVDADADTNVEVSRAASRARTRQWLAEKWNRQGYGQDRGVSVNITTSSLHLDALRMFPAKVTGSVQPALPSPAVTDTVDAEVIE